MSKETSKVSARVAMAMLASLSVLVSCGGESDAGCSSRDSVVVLSASSLKVPLERTREDFARVQPCADVTFSFGSSGALASQIVAGVPADIFLSAGKKATNQVVATGSVQNGPSDFVRNSLSIMVSNKSKYADRVTNLADLSDERNDGIVVGICDKNAPCGALADTVLLNASTLYATDLTRASVADTEATSVEALVTKIELGEVDAGLVYSSDCTIALGNADVRCISIAIEQDGNRLNEFTTYSAVLVSSSDAGRAFFDFVTSTSFTEELVKVFGFSAATP